MRGHSTSGKTWTSLNHLKNVLSCVNHSYHLPFRPHKNTWKTASITQCLVNMSKNTSRWNPSVRKTPWYSSTAARALPLQNPYTKCMSQYSTWENIKGIFATPYKQLTITQCISCAGCSIWNHKKPPLFSGHYLRNRSNLDIGVLGYISIL